MPTVLVVGASRGLGLALVLELLSKPDCQVIATVRGTPPPALAISGARILELDMMDHASVAAAAAQLPPFDVLIANAAIGGDDRLLAASTARLSAYLEANVVGTHRVVRACLPRLREGKEKKIVLVSSLSGSLQTCVNKLRGFRGPYAVTKAAVNMLAVQYHNELNCEGKEGFIVVPIHPGWVSTDMGRITGDGGMPPADSARGIVNVVWGLQPEDSAKYLQWDGQVLPW
ncbi:hypothetical protein BD626DRAFT_391779 [Schizophyllum amplum]|uniref:NAD(P)-binding protein n=1 Tax=Schizophyllum amplum TaxID=97359 RepID=A0A550CZP6_9AGAR|nr:hypothetical protein BD626DRAFT_391779 [Auriculariopsis ampla]